MGINEIKRLSLSCRLKPILAVILFLQGMPGAFAVQGAGMIDLIRFSGNEVTKESIMRQEMVVSEGDPLDAGKIEKSRQAIMNLGLFKTVEAEVLEEEGTNVLLITVDERFYILPLPLLDARLEEKEYSYGIDLRYDNLLGLNQRLKLTYEHKNSVDEGVPMRKEGSLNYSYPRILGTRNNIGVNGKIIREEITEQENFVDTGRYRRDSRSVGFRFSRWFAPESISQGWLIGGGMAVAQQIYSRQRGSGELYDDSQALEVNVGVDYNDIQEYPYHREGSAYGYGLALALPGIGSDYSYNRHRFYHRNYLALKQVDANINTQLKVGLANGSSFGAPAFDLGGGSSLRGYEGDVAVGNAMLQFNAEYHHHLSGYRQFRGVVFMDVGNAWPGVMEVDLGKLLPSVGLGLRWRVQSFVDLTLRIDVAYAVDTQATKVYATTSSSF